VPIGTGSVKQLVPDEHVLARVDRVLDLSWLRDEVTDCYCANDGRPGIDPEAAVRLMLAGLLRLSLIALSKQQYWRPTRWSARDKRSSPPSNGSLK
jgi:hypothetical protein